MTSVLAQQLNSIQLTLRADTRVSQETKRAVWAMDKVDLIQLKRGVLRKMFCPMNGPNSTLGRRVWFSMWLFKQGGTEAAPRNE